MNHVYIACKHDRHTDDIFMAFTDDENAKAQCREWCGSWVRLWSRHGVAEQPEENSNYGDWCLFFTDDYYFFVQKVEVVK